MNWKDVWNNSALVRNADFRRQVGRTFKSEPYSDDDLECLTTRLLGFLKPGSNKTLLDLACGNGLITSRIAPSFAAVTALDFSSALIATANEHFKRSNVRYLVGDALEVDRTPHDRILISGAFQYFDIAQGLQLLLRLKNIVPPDGCVVIGDVPDRDRIWNFYRGVRGRCRYALDVARDMPIVGHWWRPSDLLELADQAGWTLSIHYQPTDLPNHYFRYDAVLEPCRAASQHASDVSER